MGRFLHVAFVWRGVIKIDELKPVFDTANDWIRYAPNCWIIWTSRDVGAWSEILKPHLGTTDSLLILEVTNIAFGSQGWMPKFVWDWITKTRGVPVPEPVSR